MFASITSVALVGTDPRPVRVEAHVGSGPPGFALVGLPDTAVREAKERVRSACATSGLSFPGGRVVVNLSPADLPKGGSAYDLPIALAVLAAADKLERSLDGWVALGELALDGTVRSVRGGLGAAVIAERKGGRCMLPRRGSGEGSWVARGRLAAVESLEHAAAVIDGRMEPSPPEPVSEIETSTIDLAAVRGQTPARRGLEVAAAGGHHLLMWGSPGAGKTMLARCLPGVLPALDEDEQLEVALAWASAGIARTPGSPPPFRAPHHSATRAALLGGGSGVPVPGELTLAHRGVLFLDEFGEFPVSHLDSLRQPIEEGRVVVARKGSSACFPCEVQLVAATNPCPCGYEGDRHVACTCPTAAKQRYRARLSGPLLDRFDLRIRVPRLRPGELAGDEGEPSDPVRARVLAARKRQHARGELNRALDRSRLDDQPWSARATAALRSAASTHALTGRGWDRIRRVARTIADLAESEVIGSDHVEEALTMRATW